MKKLMTATAAILLVSCQGGSLEPVDAGDRPEWQTAAPEDVGLDSVILDKVREYAFQDEMNTQGVVVIKDGYLVAEWYADDSGPDAWATSWSVGKSFASAMVGIAWGDGHLTSLDIPMTEFVPEWEGTERAAITLRDVLTMSSGLDWIEVYALDSDERSDVADLVVAENPIEIAIDQPVLADPGTRFNYSSGDTMLLSLVIKQLTGKNPTQLAEERLAGPLNFDKFDWWEDGNDHTFTFCCVDATVRDFAKFGQLYLQRGNWGGRQILTEEWVRMTTEETSGGNPGYGLQWWLNRPNDEHSYPSLPESAYFGLGYNTQLVGVFPEQNMVIARNGTYVKPDHSGYTEEGLYGGGMFADGIGSTGTIAEGPDWSDDTFFKLVLDAIVK